MSEAVLRQKILALPLNKREKLVFDVMADIEQSRLDSELDAISAQKSNPKKWLTEREMWARVEKKLKR